MAGCVQRWYDQDILNAEAFESLDQQRSKSVQASPQTLRRWWRHYLYEPIFAANDMPFCRFDSTKDLITRLRPLESWIPWKSSGYLVKNCRWDSRRVPLRWECFNGRPFYPFHRELQRTNSEHTGRQWHRVVFQRNSPQDSQKDAYVRDRLWDLTRNYSCSDLESFIIRLNKLNPI